jgi:uncharacterized protein (DUF2141 family)
MKLRSYLFYIALVLIGAWYLGSGCASVSSPTGGAKDTLNPQLLSMYPRNGSLNYKEGLIRMEFNEAVVLKNLQSQLIITPRTEIPYKTKVNKNVVELQFDEPLKDSTTYTLNFREGIVDITEGNVAQDLYLAFSTGSYLDSLRIQGSVQTALTSKTVEGATIALYSVTDTARVMRDKPMYFTKTDKTGNYELRNLKSGSYLLYAFADKNNNLTLQTKSESYGYWPDTLRLNSSLDSIQLLTFNANADVPVVSSARASGRYYEITFNKPMQDYSLIVAGDQQVQNNFIEEQRKIRIYPVALQDSLQAIINATDSLQQTVVDTVYIRFEDSKRAKAPFSVNILPKQGSQQTKTASVQLEFSKPIATINADSLRFQYDSLTWELIGAENLEWNSRRDRLMIRKTLTPPRQNQQPVDNNADAQSLARGGATTRDQQVEFVIPKGSFISIESDSTENQEVNYVLATETRTGIISGTVNTTAENFLVQLVHANNQELVKQLSNTRQYLFRLVEPGDYLIRIVVDRNINGRWDPGNIHQLQAPEEVFFYPETITIKANWEIQNSPMSL